MTARVDTIEKAVNGATGHTVVETPVTILASGHHLAITTHVLRGAQPGRTVGIVSGLHGDEVSTAELVLSLLPLLPPAEITGTLLLVPMASPLTFETGTRSTTLDMVNCNRVFPGNPHGTVTEMLAHVLIEHVLAACDVVIDLHAEPDTMGIRCIYSSPPADDYGRKALALARASGCPIVYLTDGLPGMLTTAARARGIVAVMPETGGPLPGADGLLPEAQDEILNMLRAIGTIPGEATPAQQVFVDTVAHVRAPAGGLFRPVVGFDGVGRSVTGGALLGTIASAFSGETLAEVRAPFAESWLMMARGRLSRVHPGDPLYIVGREQGRMS
ncbi:MAG: succinylglutamate desuccinylase/aspartoacylase family protein [Thermomicrobiales bacterium]